MDFVSLTQVVRGKLSDKRFVHSVNVADEAKRLALHYDFDPDKAYTAGLLHDICKEFPKEQNLEMIKNRPDICPVEISVPQLYHAPAGACYIENNLKITDGDILNAVRYHTTGRRDMSILEEIIYLADLISIDRDFDDIKKMRKLTYKNLKKAMLYALVFCMKDTIDKHLMLPQNTIDAYNFYSTHSL